MEDQTSKEQSLMFDVDTLRKLVGLVAILLPLVVKWISSTRLSSISASYYTEAHDVFVGALFIIGALLIAYQGHTKPEMVISKLGAFAAFIVATYPTACDLCGNSTASTIHYGAAAILFGATAYFCLGPFRLGAMDKKASGEREAVNAMEPEKKLAEEQKAKEARERIVFYWVCGLVIVVCLLGAFLSNFVMTNETRQSLQFVYRVEWIALWTFGFAWLVAGKVITWVRGTLTIKLWK